MPTYEYECKSCGHKFEKLQSITARPLRKCPRCGARVRRLIGAGAGVIFKGSGFYETDYRRKRSEEPSGAKESKSAEKKPEGGKDETKPSKNSDK